MWSHSVCETSNFAPQLKRPSLGGADAFGKSEPASVIPHLLLGVGATLIATITLAYYVWSMLQGVAARRWPIANGEITAATIHRHETRFGRTRHLVVAYTYRVASSTYSGKRILFGADWLGSELHPVATERIARYAVGRSVEVRHHPRKHDRAVLEPGVTPQTYFGAGLTLLLLALGLVQLTRALG